MSDERCRPVLLEKNDGDGFATCWHITPPNIGIEAFIVTEDWWDDRYATRHIVQWKPAHMSRPFAPPAPMED